MDIKDLVSIIIPVYNAEKSIATTVESLIKQSYTDIEIIIINDGSIDNSGAVCNEIAKKDNRIRVIHIENNGVSNARNEGLRNSKGEFLTFVDADDTIDFNMVATFVKTMNEHKVDLVISQFERQMILTNRIVKSDMKYSGLYEKKEFTEKVLSDYFGKNQNNFITSCWGKLFRTKILKEQRINFDTNLKYGEDTLFTFDYIMNAEKFFVLSDYYPYKYVIHENSTSSKIEKNRYQRRKYMVEKYKKILGENYKPEYNKIYLYIGLDCFYNLSRLKYLENKDFLHKAISEIIKDKNLIDSFKYLTTEKLTTREKILLTLFNYKKRGVLLILLKVKSSFFIL